MLVTTDMSPIVPFEFNVTNDGFWGDTTATLDWCEGNYEVSRVQGLLGDRETNYDTDCFLHSSRPIQFMTAMDLIHEFIVFNVSCMLSIWL